MRIMTPSQPLPAVCTGCSSSSSSSGERPTLLVPQPVHHRVPLSHNWPLMPSMTPLTRRARYSFAVSAESSGTPEERRRSLTEQEVDYVQGSRARRAVRKIGIGGSLFMLTTAAFLGGRISPETLEALMITMTAASMIYWWGVVEGGGIGFMDTSRLNPATEMELEVASAGKKGMGLFAKTRIKKGKFLMEYAGERMDDFELFRRYGGDTESEEASYVMRVTDQEFIDCSNASRSNLARFMNHAGSKSQKCNIEKRVARKPGGRVYFFAARDIESGEELCFDYGDEYWSAKGVIPE